MNEVKTFQSRHGRRRHYLSQDDADAYDCGFAAFPRPLDVAPMVLMTPAHTGYFDAEQLDTDKREAQMEAHDGTA